METKMSLAISSQSLPSSGSLPQSTAVAGSSSGTAAASATSSRQSASAGTADVVSLSPEAQQKLASDTSKGLVFDAKGALYNGKRVAIADVIANQDRLFTHDESLAASRHRAQMEAAGFMWTNTGATDPWSLKNFFATYKNYLQSLPEEELNSQRYKGQMEVANQEIARFTAQQSSGEWDATTHKFNWSKKTGTTGKGASSLLELLQSLVKSVNQRKSQTADQQTTSTGSSSASAPSSSSSSGLPAFALQNRALIAQSRRASDVLASAQPNFDPIAMGVAAPGTVAGNPGG